MFSDLLHLCPRGDPRFLITFLFMEVPEFEEEPMTSFMANINATVALRYEVFFTEHVFQNEDGKFAMYAEGRRVFLLLK